MPRKTLITEERLEALVKQGFSADEIADMYRCSKHNIWWLMRKYVISRKEEPHYKTCPICHKKFYRGEVEYWTYRVKNKEVCSWHCVCIGKGYKNG